MVSGAVLSKKKAGMRFPLEVASITTCDPRWLWREGGWKTTLGIDRIARVVRTTTTMHTTTPSPTPRDPIISGTAGRAAVAPSGILACALGAPLQEVRYPP
jgi:hypothetical protein